jgi:uncharacterized protein YjbI with pentapeptide repeats
MISYLSCLFSLIVNNTPFYDPDTKLWFVNFSQNLGTGVLGGVITFLFLDAINLLRERYNELLSRLRSSVDDEVVSAYSIMKQEGWFSDGSLESADLSYCTLTNFDLENCNLSFSKLERCNLSFSTLTDARLLSVDFYRATLIGTVFENANLNQSRFRHSRIMKSNLRNANLTEADLSFANLSEAEMSNIVLRQATLIQSNLQDANLFKADLSGANLTFANLQNVRGLETASLVGCILPDQSKWTVNTDISQYTNPKHETFWRPPDDGALGSVWWLSKR